MPSAINKLIEGGLVDADKVGVYGQSYGGYATNLLITQTNRFAEHFADDEEGRRE